MTFKTSFRNKLAVAGVLAAGAFCVPRNATAFPEPPYTERGLKEGIMTTVPADSARDEMGKEVERMVFVGTIEVRPDFLVFGVLFSAGALIAAISLTKPKKPDFSSADCFICSGSFCGEPHHKKLGKEGDAK